MTIHEIKEKLRIAEEEVEVCVWHVSKARKDLVNAASHRDDLRNLLLIEVQREATR